MRRRQGLKLELEPACGAAAFHQGQSRPGMSEGCTSAAGADPRGTRMRFYLSRERIFRGLRQGEASISCKTPRRRRARWQIRWTNERELGDVPRQWPIIAPDPDNAEATADDSFQCFSAALRSGRSQLCARPWAAGARRGCLLMSAAAAVLAFRGRRQAQWRARVPASPIALIMVRQ